MTALVKRWVRDRMPRSAKFWSVFSCWLLTLLFVVFQGGKLALMVFEMMSVLAIYLALGRWSGIQTVKGTRSMAGADQAGVLKAGSVLRIEISMTLPGVWPIPYVLVKDRLIRRGGPEYVFERSVIPDWRRRGKAEYETHPLQRGYYRFAPTGVSTEDIFGLFEHRGELGLPAAFSVVPQTAPIRDWQHYRKLLKGQQFHSSSTRAVRETTQINGVREYSYGDRISRIHWNATARTGTWKSKEFEKESLPKTIIMLDCNQYAYKTAAQFEVAVSVSASLAEYALREGSAVGFFTAGREAVYLEPRRSRGQQEEITRHLVGVEADGTHPLINYLHNRGQRGWTGSFLIVVSPQRGDKVMQAFHWMLHHQIIPCHIAIGDGEGAASPEWAAQLTASGIAAYDVALLSDLPRVLEGRR